MSKNPNSRKQTTKTKTKRGKDGKVVKRTTVKRDTNPTAYKSDSARLKAEKQAQQHAEKMAKITGVTGNIASTSAQATLIGNSAVKNGSKDNIEQEVATLVNSGLVSADSERDDPLDGQVKSSVQLDEYRGGIN